MFLQFAIGFLIDHVPTFQLSNASTLCLDKIILTDSIQLAASWIVALFSFTVKQYCVCFGIITLMI